MAEERLRGLWRAASQGRLPHALLFHGPRGIGKFAAALLFVRGLLCARPLPAGPCGECGPCKRMLSANHLDVFVLDVSAGGSGAEAQEERIKLDRIVRRPAPAWDGPVVEEFLALRPAEGGWRALIVRDAERLRHSQNEAQNALLKMLEEPGRSVLWILVSARPEALLATVRSRCVAVPFEALSQAQTLGVLRTHGLEGEQARQLARWSRGSPGEALALRARGALSFRPLIDALLAGRSPPLAAPRAVWEVEGEFPGRTPSARQREQARAFLDLALEVAADRLRLEAGTACAELAHGDFDDPSAPGPSASALRAALEGLLQARADLERSLDAQALVDAAVLALAPAEEALGKEG